MARAELAPSRLADARERVEEAVDFAQAHELTRPLAEARWLRSRTIALDPHRRGEDAFQERYDLLTAAFEALAGTESELRGTAEARVGRILLEEDRKRLARFYLERGLEVNEELLRQVDSAFVHGELSVIDALDGRERASLEQLAAAATKARNGNALALALDSEVELARRWATLGYDAIAEEWAAKGIVTSRTLASTTDEREIRRRAESIEVELRELLVRAPAPPGTRCRATPLRGRAR